MKKTTRDDMGQSQGPGETAFAELGGLHVAVKILTPPPPTPSPHSISAEPDDDKREVKVRE